MVALTKHLFSGIAGGWLAGIRCHRCGRCGPALATAAILFLSFDLRAQAPNATAVPGAPSSAGAADTPQPANPPPTPPPALAARKLPGQVVYTAAVGSDGRLHDIHILFAAHVDFVIPALAALQQWTADPTDPVRPGPSGNRFLIFNQPAATPAQILAANFITSPDGEAPTDRPRLEFLADPVWPYDLMVKGTGGEVLVDFTVLANGSIGEIRIRAAAHPELGKALRSAIESWRFKPAIRNDAPVAVALEKRFVFRFGGRAGYPQDPLTAQLLADARNGMAHSSEGLDGRLTPIYRAPPEYPHGLIGPRAPAGSAQISIIVGRDGRARLSRVDSASSEEFGWAAATAASQWVFAPPTKDGQPADVPVLIPFSFAPRHR